MTKATQNFVHIFKEIKIIIERKEERTHIYGGSSD